MLKIYDRSMNLAFIGFFIAGVIFAVYAYTFQSITEKKFPTYVKNYAFAYYSLAFAFLVWAFASLNTDLLPLSVILGNALLLVGSLYLLTVLFHEHHTVKYAVLAWGLIFSVTFLYARLTYFAPDPFLREGVLVFNTQQPIAIILILLFLLIWLPANLKIAREVTAPMKIEGMPFVYAFLYALSTVAAIFFITFKTVPMVVASFVVLNVCFVMLLFSSYIVHRVVHSRSRS